MTIEIFIILLAGCLLLTLIGSIYFAYKLYNMNSVSSGIILLIASIASIINAIKMGNWNASINMSQSGRFTAGAIVGALYILVPSLIVIFLIYRSKSKEIFRVNTNITRHANTEEINTLNIDSSSSLVTADTKTSNAERTTVYRILLWLPLYIWVIALFDGMEQIAIYILTPIYFSYGILPAAYYIALELMRRKTALKNRIFFGEWMTSAILFIFVNLGIYYLANALSGFASQGAGQ